MKTHVVIGAGPSGVLLAKQLLEFGDGVIIVEAGSSTACSAVDDPIKWTENACSLPSFKRPLTIPQPNLNHRQLTYVQGEGMGGSTNANAMMWIAGHPSVFDTYWPKNWSSKNIRRWLSKVKEIVKPVRQTATCQFSRIINDAAAKADDVEDLFYSGGVKSYLSTIDDSKRLQMGGLLEPYISSGRLQIVFNRSANCVLFKGNQAVSVETTNTLTGQLEEFSPSGGGEIIICAGAVSTPRLLLASGLGTLPDDRGTLRCLSKDGDVAPVQIADIGTQLQDHLILPIIHLGNWWSSREGDDVHGLSANSIHGIISLNDDGSVQNKCENNEIPRTHILLSDGRIAAGALAEGMLPRLPLGKAPFYSAVLRPILFALLRFLAQIPLVCYLCSFNFATFLALVRPKSKGRLFVNSNNPNGPLLIDLGFLKDENDVTALFNGFRGVQRIMKSYKSKPDCSLVSMEMMPGPVFGFGNSRANFESYLRWFGLTYFHICGTCPMAMNGDSIQQRTIYGPGEGVVDCELRVLGTKGLRLADASIFPVDGIPSCPISAVCMAVGVACAEFIRNVPNE